MSQGGEQARDLGREAGSPRSAPGPVVASAWAADLEGLNSPFVDEFKSPAPPPLTPRKTPWDPRHWGPITWLLIAAAIVAVQAPLVWIFAEASHGVGPKLYTCLDLEGPHAADLPETERLRLLVHCRPDSSVSTFIAAPMAELPDDAKLVEVGAQPEAVNPQPVDTKYFADKTTRTEHETQARTEPRAEPPKRAKRPAPDTAPDTELPETTPESTTPRRNPDLPLPRGEASERRERRGQEAVDAPQNDTPPPDQAPSAVERLIQLPKGEHGFAEAPAPVFGRRNASHDGELLAPVGTEAGRRRNRALLAGSDDEGGDNYLPGVAPGKETVLNADSYKYADFFAMVKKDVQRHWDPNAVYVKRDPTGQLFGLKDRYTVLRVELDAKGQLLSLTTTRASGLDFMDHEAKRAFTAAAPFLNPPRALIGKGGTIRFEFGFFFEVTGGKGRFNWRRL